MPPESRQELNGAGTPLELGQSLVEGPGHEGGHCVSRSAIRPDPRLLAHAHSERELEIPVA